MMKLGYETWGILSWGFLCLLSCITSAVSQTSPLQEQEVSVGSLVTVHVDLTKSKKVLKSLMPSWMIPVGDGTIFKGVPGPGDVGVHVIPETDMTVRVTPETSSLELCGNRFSPTIVLVAVDTDPAKLSPRNRTILLSSFASHLGLSNATRLRLLSSTTSTALQLNLYRLASGPGDVPAMRRSSAGSFIAWRVGCGAIPSHQLELLQKMEKSAVTGELHRVIGYPVLHWLVGDDRTRFLLLRRRRRRKRLAVLGGLNSTIPESVLSSFGATSGSRLEDETGSGQLPMSAEGSGVEMVPRPSTKHPVGGSRKDITSRSSVASTKRLPSSSVTLSSKSAFLTSPTPKGGNSDIPMSSTTVGGKRSRDGTSAQDPLISPLMSIPPTTSVPISTTTTTTIKPTTKPTTPVPDSMPVQVRELKVIKLAFEDKLAFVIPHSAFNDTEDGSENLRLEVYHEDGVSPVSSVSGGWVTFDSARARLQVSAVSETMVGRHKFFVCAFDTKHNKICGIQIVIVEKEAPLKTEFKVCRGEHFQRFLREEELLYLEKKLSTKNMSLFLAGDRTNLDWIRFNASGRIFFGLPPPEWPLGTSTFKLKAENKQTGERAVLLFKANVQPARLAGLTHRFQMIIQVPTGTKRASLPFEFASKIAHASDLSIDKVMVLRVTRSSEVRLSTRRRRDSDSVATISWTDRRQFSLTKCNTRKIRQLVHRMVDLEIATGTLIYQKQFRRRMRPFILITPLKAIGKGPCEGISFLPVSPTTTRSPISTLTESSTTSAVTTMKSTTTQPKLPLIPPGSSITSLTVFTGLAFRSRLKLNKVEMNPKLFSVIFSSDQETVSRGSWIQLDKDLSLFGLPLKSNEGFSTYKLTIVKKNSPEILAILPLNVSVVPDDREHLVNNLVRMQLRKLRRDGSTRSFHKSVLIAVEFRLKLVLALGKHLEGSTCRGSACRKNIAVRQMSVDAEGNLVFEWAWRSLYDSVECNQAKLNKLNTRLLAWDGASRVVLSDLQLRLKQYSLVATSVNVMPQGSCRKYPNVLETDPVAFFKGPLPTTKRPFPTTKESTTTSYTFYYTYPPDGHREYRDKEHTFLVTAVIPACALLILVLVVALIVACCLHHKRKMHVRRRVINKPKRAVIFEEEMDEHPNHASKPLILPNEKPPLPPPDYVTEVMPTPVSHEEHIPLTTTSPYRHATNGGSTFRPEHPPMLNT